MKLRRGPPVGARAFAAALIAFWCATSVCALDDSYEGTVRRLVDGLYQLRGPDRAAERALVAQGSTREAVDRIVRGRADGFVRCLMNELKSYSAEHQESFSTRLRSLQESLDRVGAGPVLQDLLTLARAQSASSDACGFGELREAGLATDALN